MGRLTASATIWSAKWRWLTERALMKAMRRPCARVAAATVSAILVATVTVSVTATGAEALTWVAVAMMAMVSAGAFVARGLIPGIAANKGEGGLPSLF
ncbi:MAG: hypothetical protein PUB21_08065 [Bacteroidales bacterium]|nr:hypothetical protein [Bacteroidales bacterium]